MTMVKIKLPSLMNNNSLIKEEKVSVSMTERSKLWDDDELVMKALKVYGKYPRPQCYYEISKVCKLSNLRKSRYFHEKMMSRNPYEAKIKKLIEEEGESAYPYFKIFLEEYKTKKEREKIRRNNKNSHPSMSPNNSVGGSNTLHNNNNINNNAYCSNNLSYHENAYNNSELEDEMSNREDEFGDKYNYIDKDEDTYLNDDEDLFNEDNEPITISKLNSEFMMSANRHMANTGSVSSNNINMNNNQIERNEHSETVLPLLSSNMHHLENLELRLKLLNSERDSLFSYFTTFTSTINNLKEEINKIKSKDFIEQEQNDLEDLDLNLKQKKSELKEASLDQLETKMNEFKDMFEKLNKNMIQIGSEQEILKQDLSLNKYYSQNVNKKLEDELSHLREKLNIKNEQINDLKKRLDDSLQRNRNSSLQYSLIQNDAENSRYKLDELKNTFDKLFSKLQNLN